MNQTSHNNLLVWRLRRNRWERPGPRTCAFELAGPHALPRGGALGTVRRLAAGLGAVAGEEDLPLVDSTVVLRRAAHGAADAGALWTVGAPLALQGRLGREARSGVCFHALS